MNTVKDLDLTQPYGWQSVLEMLMALCNQAGDMNFASFVLNDWKLPTAEFRLDNPAALTLPSCETVDGALVETWSAGTVVLADALPQSLPEGTVWLLHKNGAGAVIYKAFKESLAVQKALGVDAAFSWSSMPLAPLADDAAVVDARIQACHQLGAIHTLWVRCSSDETLQQAMKQVPPCGQLQVQNMATANTWIAGKQDKDSLWQAIHN